MDAVTLSMAKASAYKNQAPLITTNPQRYGAKGDTRLIVDGVTTAGSTTFTSATAAFTSADVGRTIFISACVLGSGTTLAAGVSANATSITTHAPVTFNSPWWVGTGADAEQLTFKNLTGSSDPYSVFLTTSNISQVVVNAHSSGDPVVPMLALVTTVASVQSATSVTLTAAPTMTLTARISWLGTDDTAALQAMAAACTTHTRVDLGAHNYLVTGAITFAPQVTVKGQGSLSRGLVSTTSIVSTSKTADCLVFTSPACVVEDFSLINANLYSSIPTAGSGLSFADGSHSAVNRVNVISFYDNIKYADGDYYTIFNSGIFDPVRSGISFSTADGENFDHGDQLVTGCTIANRFVSYRGECASAIMWESGGGLRFVGNKINGNEQPTFTRSQCSKFTDGLQVAVRDGGSTSVLVISGNSIENCQANMVHIKQQTGGSSTGWFSKVVITGNEIAIGGGNGIFFDFVNGKGSVASVSGNVFTDLVTSISAKNWNGISVGPNMHNTITNVVNAQSGCLNVSMERQTVIPDNVVLWQDAVYNPANNISIGQNAMAFDRPVPSTTSTSAYTKLWTLTPAQNSAGFIRLDLTGNVVGVGSYAVRATYSFTLTTGAVTVAAIGTANAVGGLMDYTFDVATTSGKIIVGVKLNEAGGTNIAGTAGLTVNGNFTAIKKGKLVLSIGDLIPVGTVGDVSSIINSAIAASPAGTTWYVPAGQYLVNSTIVLGEKRKLVGGNENNGSVFIAGTPGMTVLSYGSASVIEDIMVQGSGIAGYGMLNLPSANKPKLTRVRVEGCSEGLVFQGLQNAKIDDCYAGHNNKNNWALYNGCANVLLINCNSRSYVSETTADSRGLLISTSTDSRLASSPFGLGNRGIGVVGGIFEDGSGSYQVGISGQLSGQVAFWKVEFNGGVSAAIGVDPSLVTKGSLVDIHSCSFTLQGYNQAVVATTGAVYIDPTCSYSGLGGKSIRAAVSGSVGFLDANIVDLASSTFRTGLGSWVRSGSGNITYDLVKRRAIIESTNIDRGAKLAFSGSNSIVKYQIFVVKFYVLNIIGASTVRLNLLLSSGVRYVGDFSEGKNEVTLESLGDEIGLHFSAPAAVAVSFELCYVKVEPY